MNPHTNMRPSEGATVVDLLLVVLFLFLLGAASWFGIAAVRAIRRPRRWPRQPRSWLRDFRAEARNRNGGRK